MTRQLFAVIALVLWLVGCSTLQPGKSILSTHSSGNATDAEVLVPTLTIASTTPLVSDPTKTPILSPTPTDTLLLPESTPTAGSTIGPQPELDISLNPALAANIWKQSSKDSRDITAPEAKPEFPVYTLEGYPLQSLVKPQIFVLRINDEEAAGEATAMNTAKLREILQNKPDLEAHSFADINQPLYRMPWLFPTNAGSMMYAQVEYLDFQNGVGVRYLAQSAQALTVVNNRELRYTFQGLTRDGKYHVIAVLPTSHPDLLDRPNESPNGDVSVFTDVNKNFQYLQKVVRILDEAQPASFTPNLAKLDAMIRSIGIR
jgi:hypothetical protein